jgi:hypothetical protein
MARAHVVQISSTLFPLFYFIFGEDVHCQFNSFPAGDVGERGRARPRGLCGYSCRLGYCLILRIFSFSMFPPLVDCVCSVCFNIAFTSFLTNKR